MEKVATKSPALSLSSAQFLSGLGAVLLSSFYVFYWSPLFALGFFTVVPLLLSKRWLTHPEAPRAFFVRLKLYSVLVACIFFAFMLLQGWTPAWFHLAAAALLVFNISEALVVDFRKGGVYSWVNGAMGLVINILLLTTFYRGPTLTPPVLGELPLSWIIAYTVWNWTFVFLHWPKLASKHMVVLGASVLVALLSEGTWLLSRAYLLTYFLMIQFTVPINFSVHFLDSMATWDRSKTMRWALAAVGASTLWATLDYFF